MSEGRGFTLWLPMWLLRKIVRRNLWLLAEQGSVSSTREPDPGLSTGRGQHATAPVIPGSAACGMQAELIIG